MAFPMTGLPSQYLWINGKDGDILTYGSFLSFLLSHSSQRRYDFRHVPGLFAAAPRQAAVEHGGQRAGPAAERRAGGGREPDEGPLAHGRPHRAANLRAR